jgi:uncharacterized membrane protein YtjA (UPF0391 family)
MWRWSQDAPQLGTLVPAQPFPLHGAFALLFSEDGPMLGWALAFFVAAIIAAAFGFGVIASAFAGIAQLLFFIFLGLLALTLILSLFSRAAPGAGAGVRLASLLAVAVLVGVGIYAWQDHNMTAERVGRSIDHGTAELTHNAGDAIGDAAGRTGNFLRTSAHEVRDDVADGLNEAKTKVEPDRSQTQDN